MKKGIKKRRSLFETAAHTAGTQAALSPGTGYLVVVSMLYLPHFLPSMAVFMLRFLR